jgi:penicillin-binding protein 1C
LHEIPQFLQQAFIQAEDRRFYTHSGVDWWARLSAVYQNLINLRKIRGASTITEQVIRLVHSRPRTIWSRLLEGVEARRLEAKLNKASILEYYLNQVPYARQRLGVLQAAHLYFDRDLSTLSKKEMLALAVLVRAPSRLDPISNSERLEKPVAALASRLRKIGALSNEDYHRVLEAKFVLKESSPPVEASHFVREVLKHPVNVNSSGGIRTTLDSELQVAVQKLLENKLQSLIKRQVSDGAVLVVENESGNILAWVNAASSKNQRGSNYDAIRLKRQPGSTLKPFLYALALERGWTASTLINDAPLEQAIGRGLHGYRNYSGRFYGQLRLREALGNSLNSPAIRAVNFVGRSEFLTRLRKLGFNSLNNNSDFYGDGIALGNAEVSLFELTRAYRALANRGKWSDLNYHLEPTEHSLPDYMFSSDITSLISDILSDPEARRKEFGSLLRFPIQTAVKTGTSNDYKDSWALGFSSTHTVGVWMGNTDRKPMLAVSGALGPATILRAVFWELEKRETTSPLYLSPGLISRSICSETGQLAGPSCPDIKEWFLADNQPMGRCDKHQHAHEISEPAMPPIEIKLPTPGLHLARDPRIPDENEFFPFEVNAFDEIVKVEWQLNGRKIATSDTHRYLWKLVKGAHQLRAEVWIAGEKSPKTTSPVRFIVQ